VNAREVDIKESILMTRMEYSISKEKMEDSECGWSDGRSCARSCGGDAGPAPSTASKTEGDVVGYHFVLLFFPSSPPATWSGIWMGHVMGNERTDKCRGRQVILHLHWYASCCQNDHVSGDGGSNIITFRVYFLICEA
jgi:hypothetical protein